MTENERTAARVTAKLRGDRYVALSDDRGQWFTERLRDGARFEGTFLGNADSIAAMRFAALYNRLTVNDPR